MKNIIINSESSGKFRLEKKGGRDFLVTQMLPIQANSIMNGLFYPVSTIASSYNQLDSLPAPAGHPIFNGKSVSAFDPEGGSSFNVGAFVRSPKLNGLNVIADLVIDVEVANRSDKGQEILHRIKNKKRIGVSTGMQGRILEQSGKQGNSEYFGIVNEINYDHVAILLNEIPAGDNTYTLNSLITDFENPPVTTTKKRGTIMREISIDTSVLSLEDHKFLELQSADPSVIVNALKNEVSEKEAAKIINNAGKHVVPAREYEDFLANRDSLKEFTAQKNEARQEQIDFVIKNSKMDVEHVQELSESALTSLVNSIAPPNKHIVNGKIETPKFTPLEGA